MFRWLWPSSNQQPTQEEQWIARREVKEQLAIAAKTREEWDAMMRKWEANDYEDFNPNYQFTMQTRMRDAAAVTERFLRMLSPEEQTTYRKTFPDFTLEIPDYNNSNKKD